MIFILIVLVSPLLYGFDWPGWTGFNTYTIEERTVEGTKVTITTQTVHYKTLWDWLQLLVVPLVLALVGIQLNRMQSLRAEWIARDASREVGLQQYFGRMKELLLEHNLNTDGVTDAVRSIALSLTVSVLREMDGRRRGSVIHFLYESGLITVKKHVLELFRPDLTGIDLQGVYLDRVYLPVARFVQANLEETVLEHARLELSDFTLANLKDSSLTKAQLENTKFVESCLVSARL